jgi:hypothetical protein
LAYLENEGDRPLVQCVQASRAGKGVGGIAR